MSGQRSAASGGAGGRRALVDEAERQRARLSAAVGWLLAAQAAQAGPAVLRPRHAHVRATFKAAIDAARAVTAHSPDVTAVQTWRRELTRLKAAGQRHLMQESDDLGALVPEVVQVGSRAATGPDQPGLQFEAPSQVARTLPEPRIGVDLRASVDRDPTSFPVPRSGRPAQRPASRARTGTGPRSAA
jgi:hypothetical protein